MRKLLLALGLVCFTTPVFAAQDINAGISGSWFNSNQSGHGFAMEYTDCPQSPEGCLVVYWFVYSPGGEPIFLLGSGLPINGNVAEGELRYFSGLRFGSFTPPPSPREGEVWGTLTLTFASCDQGTARYTADYVSPDGDEYTGSDSFPIERLAFVSDLDCTKAVALKDVPDRPVAGIWIGKGAAGADRISIIALITEEGEAWFWSLGLGAYMFAGQLPEDSGTATLKAYPEFGSELPNGQSSGQVELDFEIGPPDRMEGTLTVPGPGGQVTYDFALRPDGSFVRDATLNRMEGNWQLFVYSEQFGTGFETVNLQIKPNGTLRTASLSNGCKLQGDLEPAGDGEFNVFDASIDITACPFDGSYQGVAWVQDVEIRTGEDDFLYLRLHNGIHSIVADGFSCPGCAPQ